MSTTKNKKLVMISMNTLKMYYLTDRYWQIAEHDLHICKK